MNASQSRNSEWTNGWMDECIRQKDFSVLLFCFLSSKLSYETYIAVELKPRELVFSLEEIRRIQSDFGSFLRHVEMNVFER